MYSRLAGAFRGAAALIAVICLCLSGSRDLLAAPFGPGTLFTVAGENYLYLDISGANTQVDINHSSSWYISVASGKSFDLYGGDFVIKRGSAQTQNISLTLYSIGTGGALTQLAQVSKTPSQIQTSYTATLFAFASHQTLTAGRYYVILGSTAPTAGNDQYFVKGVSAPGLGDGVTDVPSSTATPSAAPAAANISLSKQATSSVTTSGTITYTIMLGNDGGAASGTSATVKDQLPTGVVATAVSAGSGVSSVNCGSLPSSAGALLTCSTTLSATLASASAPSATFTITATAPSSAGSITNYASVDPSGGSSPATPGSSCATSSCGSASTTVSAPANFTLSKSATASVTTSGSITYTLGLGNSGGVATGTSTTVKDQLPTGVVATAVTAGTGVSAVDCGSLPSSSGALLSCSVTLSSGLSASASNGTAAFTITATAPGSAGSITNYASVSTDGVTAAAAPGGSCATSSCASASTTVSAPTNFTLSKTATSSVTTSGSITYTLGLGNSGGQTSGTSATVADQLPAGVVATAVTAGSGVSSVNCGSLPSASGALLSCSVTLSRGLSAGASNGAASFTITATAPGSAGSITNYASVDASGGSSPATPGALCSTTSCASAGTTVTTPANFTLSKSATGSVATGGSITYTLGIGNSGGTTSGTSVTVADQLPAGATATAATRGTGVSSVSCGSLPSSSGALLSCSVTLSSGLAAGAANGTAAFTLTVTAPGSAGSITNYASVDASGGSSPATPGALCGTSSCASASTTVNAAPNFTLSESATATVVTSSAITYTLNLGNSGGAASGTSTVVAVQMPTGVTATAVTAGTGVSSVSCGSLPAASGALLSCSVTLSSGLSAGASNGAAAFTITATAPGSAGSITSYASVSTDGSASPATPGASCLTSACGSASTTVNTAAHFTLSKSATGTVVTGGAITYTLGLGNSGGTTSGTSVTVADQLPTGATATAATAGTGVSSVNCGTLPSSSGALLTCSVTLTSGLSAGASNGAAAFTLTVTAPGSAGSITNYASVDANGGSSPATPGASCATSSCASASTTVNTPAHFTLSKSATGTVVTGGAITYTLGLGNSGGTASGTSVTVADQLPTGATATAATAGTGVSSVNCGTLPSSSGALLTCSVTLSSGLAAGASNGTAAFTLTVTAPGSAGSITNYASVDANGGSSPATPGASCATSSCASASTTVNSAANFTLSKSATGTVVTGGAITYTLGLGNSGGTASGTSVTVADQLPAGATATAATAGTGVSSVNCGTLPSSSGALLTCSVTLSSGLAAGAANGTAAFTLTVTAPGSAGSITNYASVDATGGSSPATPGRTCSTSSCANAATTVNTPANVTLGMSGTSAVAPSGTITYTLNLGNSGGTASGTSLTLSNKLPAGVVATAVTAGTGVSSVNCGTLPSSSGATLTCSVTLSSGLAAGASNGAAAYTITATAPASSGSITNYASVDATGGNSPATPGASCSTSSCASAATTVATATNVTLSSTATSAVAPSGTITYTLNLGNSGGTISGTSLRLSDQLPAGVVATAVTAGTGVSSVSCGSLPSSSGAALTCSVTLTSGLAAGASNGAASYTITATAPASSGSITNYASVDPTGGNSPATPGASCSTSSCTSASTTVATAMNVTLGMTGTASVLTNGTITYTLNLGNSGGTVSGTTLTVAVQLPAGEKATAATIGTGVTAVSCTNLNTTGALLTCTVTLNAGLAAGAANGTKLFTLTATAPATSGTVTNYASVDPTSGSSPATPGASCSTSSCASAATTVATPASFTLSKTATSVVATSGSVTYTFGIGNSGGTVSGTSVTMADQLPTGMRATGVTAGTGVTSVSCTNLNTASALVVCTITLTSGLPASSATGTATFTLTTTAPTLAGAITNYASVDPTGGTSPATPGSSCVSASCANAGTTVQTPSDLTATVTHTGTITQGAQGVVFTASVSNVGGQASTGLVTLTTTLPTGIVPASASGSGWSCSVSGQTVTCTRTDALAADSSYPSISILTNVATTAPASVSVTAVVNGGGQTNTSNDTGTDPVTVLPALAPSLQANIDITSSAFLIGLQSGYTADVRNTGTGPSSGVVTATFALTGSVTVTSVTGAGWNCTVQPSQVVCTRSDSLPAGASYPTLTVLVEVTTSTPESATVTATVSGGGMTSPKAQTLTVPIGYAQADLTPHITHEGVLTRLQPEALFNIDVQNLGPNQSTGIVRLHLDVPEGLRILSIVGDGWNCTVQGQGIDCTRADHLVVLQKYPLTLKVAVRGDAADGLVFGGRVTGDHDPVPQNDTTKDTIHVITFLGVEFKVDKTVDRPMLKIGEAAQFSLVAKNLSEAQLDDVTLTDTLARGFGFVNGTARIIRKETPTSSGSSGTSSVKSLSGSSQIQASTPAIPTTIAGSAIDSSAVADGRAFHIGKMRGLEELTITYYTIVGMDAKPGTQLTKVTGTFKSPIGDVIAAAPVEVAVTVAPTQFSSSQLLVGRVFDDANDNGVMDKGEKGLAGVRVLLPTGQAAVTDKDGLYNMPAVAPGSVTVTIDPDTVPAGYGIRATNDPRDSGWTRLVRSPLGAGAILRANFALAKVAARVAPAAAIPAARPSTSEVVREAGTAPGAGDAMTRRTPVIGRFEITTDRDVMSAGGRDRMLVTIRAFGIDGAPVKSAVVNIEATMGQWLLPGRPEADQAMPALKRTADPLEYCRADAAAVELPQGLRTGSVVIRDGVAHACLQSDVAPATAELTVATDDGSRASAKTSVRFAATRNAPVVAAIGEVAFGRGEPATADTPATGDVHGQGALFFQGQLARDRQLTLALTTGHSINEAAGTARRFDNDSGDRTYPIFGDTSTRQELAASNSRAYARLDFGRSSILYGDLRGDQSRLNRSGLLDVSRSLTGTEVHLEKKAGQWLSLQAARPDTAYARDLFPGTAAGFLELSHGSMLIGSDTLTLEVRDRRQPDIVIERKPLVRGVDYVVDQIAGVMYLNRPLPLFDQSLSVVQVVASYEYETAGLRNSVFVARGQQEFSTLGLTVRAMGFREGVDGGTDTFIGGLEADQKLPNRGHLHVELPVSRGVSLSGAAGVSDGTGVAIRAELDQPLLSHGAAIKARFSRTDNVFANPYGSPVVPGTTTGTGAFEFTPTKNSRVRFSAMGEAAHSKSADATRGTFSAEWSQKVGARYEFSGILDARHLNDDRAARQIDSQLLTAMATWKPTARFEATARREQNLGTADPTYPDQTVLSGRYRVGSGAQLFATQRWSDAPIIPISGVGAGGLLSPLSTRETAIGVESKVHNFTTLTTRYQLDGGVNGVDGYAVLGVLTRIPVARHWSLDGGLDRAVNVQGGAPGYTSATGGVSFTPERWRASLHYQVRDNSQRTQLLSAGIAGQLTSSISAMGHYRTAGFVRDGEKQSRVDALAALAIRPKQSDRVGVLFAWNYGDELSPEAALTAEAGNRIGRLSADGYYQATSRLEIYQRLAMLRTNLGLLGTASTYLWQGRAQYKLARRFDVAGELRWVDELGTSSPGRLIGAGEFAYWMSRDLRVGVGYTTRPWSAVGPTLETTAGRGGAYLVLTSRLSSLFDLFSAKKPAAGSEK